MPYSVKKNLEEFCNQNKNKNKIVILDKIKHISTQDENIYYKDILSNIEADTVILIGLSRLDCALRKNKNILIKEYQRLNENTLISIKHFIECFKKENSVYFISSEDDRLCNIV